MIAVSESIAGYAARLGVDSSRVWVVPNGVPAVARLANRPRPRSPWTLGCVALIRPRKGIEVLLAALAEFRRQGATSRLRAVGTFETPEYERAVQAEVARLGLQSHVAWTGFAGDVPAELAQMDLFVLPSLFGEGMPMVVLEAMAAGVPVVATRVEGVPQVIRPDVDGLLAAAGDASDLAAQIRRVLDGLVDWQSLRMSAHRRQVELFSDRSMASATAAVYIQAGVAGAVHSKISGS